MGQGWHVAWVGYGPTRRMGRNRPGPVGFVKTNQRRAGLVWFVRTALFVNFSARSLSPLDGRGKARSPRIERQKFAVGRPGILTQPFAIRYRVKTYSIFHRTAYVDHTVKPSPSDDGG